ncbi:Uncharacterized protein FKW44_004820, partial [Caligus rogercresseyi]
MEEEKKACDVRFLLCRRSPKEVIEFFNYPKSTVYDQWKAWNSFKKNDVHRKKRSRSLGPPGPTVCRRGEEKVNEDGSRSYAKLAAEMGSPIRPSPHHQQGPGLQFVQEEAQDDLDGGDQGV